MKLLGRSGIETSVATTLSSPSVNHATAGTSAVQRDHQFLTALRQHWPEYVMEGAELGLFMISACVVVVLLEHPTSAITQALPHPFLRRVLIGIAMGLTAIGLIYSPLGKRSGAHFNPSVTLTFLRLGKVRPWDALFYVVAQFTGGLLGVLLAGVILSDLVAHPSVNYAVTTPGAGGPWIAFIAEVTIAFIQMSMVLRVSNTTYLARFTGLFAGVMVAMYISLEAPYSGMSMNPARTFASAFPAQVWTALWVYFTAPLVGMFLAAELYLRRHGLHQVFCAKLHHYNKQRCIFRCRFEEMGLGTRS